MSRAPSPTMISTLRYPPEKAKDGGEERDVEGAIPYHDSNASLPAREGKGWRERNGMPRAPSPTMILTLRHPPEKAKDEDNSDEFG